MPNRRRKRRNSAKSKMITFGFDPGGPGRFGCAAVDWENRSLRTRSANSVDECMRFAKNVCAKKAPVFAGIDTLMFWQSVPQGWRGADEFLRKMYPASQRSVMHSNALPGAMSIQGAALAIQLRKSWPAIGLTETHPKVLWRAISKGAPYPRRSREVQSSDAENWIHSLELADGNVSDEDQFDAVLSAFAAHQSFTGKWTHDLISEKAAAQQNENTYFLNDVHYFWPE